MDNKKKIIEFYIKNKILQFGEFTLNSGRISPYFFNSSILSTGKDILRIGLYYAHAIINSKKEFNVLFGAAYKGIPIVTATSIALNYYYNINISYSFNRKEEKIHGEKGIFVGKNIKNKKVIILDDVLTSGKSINNSIKIIEKYGGIISSIFVLLDRQEKKYKTLYTKKNIKVISIINIDDILYYLFSNKTFKKIIPILEKYRKNYGLS